MKVEVEDGDRNDENSILILNLKSESRGRGENARGIQHRTTTTIFFDNHDQEGHHLSTPHLHSVE